MWRPNIKQMSTPIKIQSRIEIDINGQVEILCQDKSDPEAFCNWKGKGGTETVQSGSLSVADTAELTMWYRPDITERDFVLLNHTIPYEIVNIENVEMRNQFLVLKVRRVVNN